MNTETLVAIIAAVSAVVAAIVGAGTSLWVSRRRAITDQQIARDADTARIDAAQQGAQGQRDAADTAANVQWAVHADQRQVQFDAALAKFRGPLLHATFDLQSRLWNILCKRFLQQFHRDGTERQQKYVVDNTLFVIAQYFCWIEIIRLEVQFVDMGDETSKLSALRNKIYYLWQTSTDLDPPFMVWAGEQRAIGESLIIERAAGRDCMGYAAFLVALEAGQLELLDPLRDDIVALAANPDYGRVRLEKIQAALIELLELLDPDFTFFAEKDRTLATDHVQQPS